MAIKWNKIYREIAIAIYKIRIEHDKNAGSVIYNIVNKDPLFLTDNRWLAKYSSTIEQSLDPMVIFASISGSTLRESLRLIRVNKLLNILIGRDEIEIDFRGCPTPVPTSLMSVRSVSGQEALWVIFENVMKKGRGALEDDMFEKLKDIKGVDIVSFTIFLHWIDAEQFLPLDKNTVGYLIRKGEIERPPISYIEYFDLISKHTESFLETPIIAYYSQESNLTETQNKNTDLDPVLKQVLEDSPSHAGKFRIIAIKPLNNIHEKFRKVLVENKIYSFYRAYKIEKFESITYESKLDLNLYNQNKLSINISAIVGKNGTGKSSIAELIYLAINCLSKRHGRFTTELKDVKGFNFELYYSADFCYCFRYQEEKIIVYKYETVKKGFINPVEIPLDSFDFTQFFYTIAINYSLYGLNSSQVGSWIEGLFHKNDSYQVPIVINPYRKLGNVNVNNEEGLTRQRLLVRLLMPLPDNTVSINLRKLTDTRSADWLVLTFNPSMFKSLYQVKNEHNEPIKEFGFAVTTSYYKPLLEKICTCFDIDPDHIPKKIDEPVSIIDYAFCYILKKLVSIARNYDQWSFFSEQSNSFENYDHYVDLLSEDTSHITHKLRQAINFIKYDHIRLKLPDNFKESTRPISIAELSDEISLLVSTSDDSIDTIHMIPPSFFNTKILMDDNSDYNRLSSGEKQRIHAVSSLGYHLYNINSVSVHNNLINYRYVNVIFDEVELYFHPEMQQDFINHLLAYIGRLNLDRIAGINILIITHSPFILSDIPNPNILFLSEVDPDIKTFGSNIHDLLAHSFFMRGFMGGYVRKIIKEISDYLSPNVEFKPVGWTEERSENIIRVIGEPLIKARLQEMHRSEFKSKATKELRIEALKAELKALEDEKDS